jgi:hypothetical protein
MVVATAWAGGPRFISGTSGYAQAGVPMGWYTSQPMYFTDPGNLSSTVGHAQADAMVAAAAAVWNVPTANVTLAKGGQLAEHVSGANSFNLTNAGFPADVEAANYQAIQIPIVYDSDGSIIDALLGSGGSDPSGCTGNRVLESVDSFGWSATIQHAVIVLNGRCVGSSPQQMLEMQYQLTRVFGRVLGLAWSQLNDNVFTSVSPVTAAQEALWPLMHPIDVIGNTYAYQSVQNAFALRPDDVAALEGLYPVLTTAGTKTKSTLNTVAVSGSVNFPVGQGMELVNVTVTRWLIGVDGWWEPYPVVSGMAGYEFQQNGGNPVSGTEAASLNGGSNQAAVEGTWSMPYLPIGSGGANLSFATETINPDYFGDYSVGPYQRPVVTMSGSPQVDQTFGVNQGTSITVEIGQTNAVVNWCWNPDSFESNPPVASATGWWSGSLCATGFTSWRKTTVNANTSWTIEVTALDESGAVTQNKMQPVIGVWNASDPTGTLPTVASQPTMGGAWSMGATALQMPGTPGASTLRMVIADQYGAGRVDFAYTARILYAASVAPAKLSSGGGQIVIAGTGFLPGNEVMVNGVRANVSSWTSTQIVATAPTMVLAGATSGGAVDVVVMDGNTGGSTDMQGALTYVATAGNQIQLVSAPATLETGVVAATPFAVRVLAQDGVTPVASASVTFVVVGGGTGGAVVTGCQSGPGCVVKTDGTGLAQTPVMGIAAGAVTVRGTEMSAGMSVQAAIVDVDPVRTAVMGAVPQYLAAGAAGSWSVSLTTTQDGIGLAGVPVAWSTTGVGFTLTPPGELTAAIGTAAVVAQVNAIAGGVGGIGASTNVVMGCAWSTVCGSWTVYGVSPTQWVVAVSSGAGQSVRTGGLALVPVMMLVTDGAGHAVPGAAVNVYQTAYAWEGACGVTGACASAPVLTTSRSSAVSDGSGMVQVTPLRVAGVAQVVKIAASAGTRGFAVASLAVTP